MARNALPRLLAPSWLSLLLLAGCGLADGWTQPRPGDNSSPIEPGDSPWEGDASGCEPPQASGDPDRSWCPASSGHANLPHLRARDTAEGGNATGVHGCASSRYAHYEQPDAQGPQLHVVSIYEPAGPEGTVEVRVKRRGASVLVLSAYSETTWKVVVEPGAAVERILVNGYEPQHLVAPTDIPVEVHSHEQDGKSFGGFGYEWPSYRTTQLVDAAEAKAGHALTSFRGCYTSSSFDLDEPGKLRPPHPLCDGKAHTLPAGCEALAEESVHCMTLRNGTPTLIGLDSGSVCSSQVPAALSDLHGTSSLAWRGDHVYACVHERGLARLSLLDGSVDIAPVACQAVANHRGGLLVMLGDDGKDSSLPGTLVHFDDFAAAARRKASCLFKPHAHASRMAVHGDRAYLAWHSTNELSTTGLGASTRLQTVRLEGYDDWVQGMDVTDDGRLLILGPRHAPGLYLFEARTGKSLGTRPLRLSGAPAEGLSCRSRVRATGP